MSRLLYLISEFFHRLFARKSPIGFDREIGSWRKPDVVLKPSTTSPPLQNNDCKASYVVYAAAINHVEKCDFAAQAAALAEALARAAEYFNNDFECLNRDCLAKRAEVIWSGVSCHKRPLTVSGAVLVLFWCTVEL